MTYYKTLLSRLKVNPSHLFIYVVLYFTWGFFMNEFGIWAEIAHFKFRFQIFTCYILFMVPVSLILRGLPWYTQYAYGTVLMGFVEFGGYAIGSSIAMENNLLDQFFGIRNFSLGMTLFFGLYFPLGNFAVAKIASWFRL